jgi:hypothetical protein
MPNAVPSAPAPWQRRGQVARCDPTISQSTTPRRFSDDSPRLEVDTWSHPLLVQPWPSQGTNVCRPALHKAERAGRLLLRELARMPSRELYPGEIYAMWTDPAHGDVRSQQLSRIDGPEATLMRGLQRCALRSDEWDTFRLEAYCLPKTYLENPEDWIAVDERFQPILVDQAENLLTLGEKIIIIPRNIMTAGQIANRSGSNTSVRGEIALFGSDLGHETLRQTILAKYHLMQATASSLSRGDHFVENDMFSEILVRDWGHVDVQRLSRLCRHARQVAIKARDLRAVIATTYLAEGGAGDDVPLEQNAAVADIRSRFILGIAQRMEIRVLGTSIPRLSYVHQWISTEPRRTLGMLRSTMRRIYTVLGPEILGPNEDQLVWLDQLVNWMPLAAFGLSWGALEAYVYDVPNCPILDVEAHFTLSSRHPNESWWYTWENGQDLAAVHENVTPPFARIARSPVNYTADDMAIISLSGYTVCEDIQAAVTRISDRGVLANSIGGAEVEDLAFCVLGRAGFVRSSDLRGAFWHNDEVNFQSYTLGMRQSITGWKSPPLDDPAAAYRATQGSANGEATFVGVIRGTAVWHYRPDQYRLGEAVNVFWRRVPATAGLPSVLLRPSQIILGLRPAESE